MTPWKEEQGKQQGSLGGGPNTTGAFDAAFSVYRTARRRLIAGSLLIAVPLTLGVAVASRISAVALAAGIVCGILNALLSMRSSERLADHRSTALFVLSSVLRIFVFGILPVGLAVHGSWWTLVAYFAGFFTPLALFAVSVARAPRMN